VSTPFPPEAVGPVSGTTPPDRLPWIGTEVIDVDGIHGFVAFYQFYVADQVWFPVRFGAITHRRKLGKTATRSGFVRLAEAPPVTSLAAARKPPRDGVAERAAAS
jgi:hypothetical protein